MKTVLLGLDGATYTVLDHLVAQGVMPNLAALYGRGCRAVLRSTPLPLTPQAWTSLATGRSAGNHGIHDFVRPQIGPESIYFRVNNSRDNHCQTLWKYASDQGKRVTLLNYYGTAPPEPIDGHVIPGFVSGRHLRRSCHPADLFNRLQVVPDLDAKMLGLDLEQEREALQDMEPERWGVWIRHHIERERVWFAVLDHLMTREPSDLTAIVLDGVDKIQHLAYRYLDPALMPAAPTPWERQVIALCHDYFRQVDDFIGRLDNRLGRGGRLFLASDHGFTATHEIVYINKWLKDQGWLQYRNELPEDHSNAIFSEKLTHLTDAIDLARTRAFALLPSCNGIYLVVRPEEYDAFRDEVIGRLLQLRGPDGSEVVHEIKKRGEWFAGPWMHHIPDLTLTLRDHGFISVLNAPEVVVRRPSPSGTHHPDGVLIGTGPGIRQGANAGLLNILDVTPLLAHSLGLEIPADYEGVFPATLYEADYLAADPPRGAAQRTPESVMTSGIPAGEEMNAEEEAILLDRLRSLGYVE
jgi:predicted AlkP superfamily phosphohydrolase/phosphomutase